MIERINDGGPAFPQSDLSNYGIGPGTSPDGARYEIYGMSLRDWFAGQALAGLATVFFGSGGKSDFPEAARRAYQIADSMIAARALLLSKSPAEGGE